MVRLRLLLRQPRLTFLKASAIPEVKFFASALVVLVAAVSGALALDKPALASGQISAEI